MTYLPTKPVVLCLFFIALFLGVACSIDSGTLSDTDQSDSGSLLDTDPVDSGHVSDVERVDSDAENGGSDVLPEPDVKEPSPGVVEYTLTTEANTPVTIVPLG